MTQHILQAWANHFESLGRPLESPLFDNNYHTQVIEDLKIISSMSAEAEPPVFTPEEVATTVKSLHNNKSAEPQGLMAEHLKMAPPATFGVISSLFNAISKRLYVPCQLTCGDVITIPKKGKDPLLMGNHRGITITSVLGKVHVLVARVRSTLRAQQSPLQFGFTEKLSPGMAALVCSEVLSNNKDSSRDTFVATVDVQKAFDSVWHDSLLRNLHISTDGDSTYVAPLRLPSPVIKGLRFKKKNSWGTI